MRERFTDFENRDRLLFKQLFIDCGIPTPTWYHMEEHIDPALLDKIEYPIIIKPSDVCTVEGITICNNEEELLGGYDRALSCSEKRQIVVEKFIQGQEFVVSCYVSKGEMKLIFCTDTGNNSASKQEKAFFSLNGDHSEQVIEKYSDAIAKMIKKLEIENGLFFLMGIRDGENYYFFDSDFRMERAS